MDKLKFTICIHIILWLKMYTKKQNKCLPSPCCSCLPYYIHRGTIWQYLMQYHTTQNSTMTQYQNYMNRATSKYPMVDMELIPMVLLMSILYMGSYSIYPNTVIRFQYFVAALLWYPLTQTLQYNDITY